MNSDLMALFEQDNPKPVSKAQPRRPQQASQHGDSTAKYQVKSRVYQQSKGQARPTRGVATQEQRPINVGSLVKQVAITNIELVQDQKNENTANSDSSPFKLIRKSNQSSSQKDIQKVNNNTSQQHNTSNFQDYLLEQQKDQENAKQIESLTKMILDQQAKQQQQQRASCPADQTALNVQIQQSQQLQDIQPNSWSKNIQQTNSLYYLSKKKASLSSQQIQNSEQSMNALQIVPAGPNQSDKEVHNSIRSRKLQSTHALTQTPLKQIQQKNKRLSQGHETEVKRDSATIDSQTDQLIVKSHRSFKKEIQQRQSMVTAQSQDFVSPQKDQRSQLSNSPPKKKPAFQLKNANQSFYQNPAYNGVVFTQQYKLDNNPGSHSYQTFQPLVPLSVNHFLNSNQQNHKLAMKEQKQPASNHQDLNINLKNIQDKLINSSNIISLKQSQQAQANVGGSESQSHKQPQPSSEVYQKVGQAEVQQILPTIVTGISPTKVNNQGAQQSNSKEKANARSLSSQVVPQASTQDQVDALNSIEKQVAGQASTLNVVKNDFKDKTNLTRQLQSIQQHQIRQKQLMAQGQKKHLIAQQQQSSQKDDSSNNYISQRSQIKQQINSQSTVLNDQFTLSQQATLSNSIVKHAKSQMNFSKQVHTTAKKSLAQKESSTNSNTNENFSKFLQNQQLVVPIKKLNECIDSENINDKDNITIRKVYQQNKSEAKKNTVNKSASVLTPIIQSTQMPTPLQQDLIASELKSKVNDSLQRASKLTSSSLKQRNQNQNNHVNYLSKQYTSEHYKRYNQHSQSQAGNPSKSPTSKSPPIRDISGYNLPQNASTQKQAPTQFFVLNSQGVTLKSRNGQAHQPGAVGSNTQIGFQPSGGSKANRLQQKVLENRTVTAMEGAKRKDLVQAEQHSADKSKFSNMAKVKSDSGTKAHDVNQREAQLSIEQGSKDQYHPKESQQQDATKKSHRNVVVSNYYNKIANKHKSKYYMYSQSQAPQSNNKDQLQSSHGTTSKDQSFNYPAAIISSAGSNKTAFSNEKERFDQGQAYSYQLQQPIIHVKNYANQPSRAQKRNIEQVAESSDVSQYVQQMQHEQQMRQTQHLMKQYLNQPLEVGNTQCQQLELQPPKVNIQQSKKSIEQSIQVSPMNNLATYNKSKTECGKQSKSQLSTHKKSSDKLIKNGKQVPQPKILELLIENISQKKQNGEPITNAQNVSQTPSDIQGQGFPLKTKSTTPKSFLNNHTQYNNVSLNMKKKHQYLVKKSKQLQREIKDTYTKVFSMGLDIGMQIQKDISFNQDSQQADHVFTANQKQITDRAKYMHSRKQHQQVSQSSQNNWKQEGQDFQQQSKSESPDNHQMGSKRYLRTQYDQNFGTNHDMYQKIVNQDDDDNSETIFDRDNDHYMNQNCSSHHSNTIEQEEDVKGAVPQPYFSINLETTTERKQSQIEHPSQQLLQQQINNKSSSRTRNSRGQVGGKTKASKTYQVIEQKYPSKDIDQRSQSYFDNVIIQNDLKQVSKKAQDIERRNSQRTVKHVDAKKVSLKQQRSSKQQDDYQINKFSEYIKSQEEEIEPLMNYVQIKSQLNEDQISNLNKISNQNYDIVLQNKHKAKPKSNSKNKTPKKQQSSVPPRNEILQKSQIKFQSGQNNSGQTLETVLSGPQVTVSLHNPQLRASKEQSKVNSSQNNSKQFQKFTGW